MALGESDEDEEDEEEDGVLGGAEEGGDVEEGEDGGERLVCEKKTKSAKDFPSNFQVGARRQRLTRVKQEHHQSRPQKKVCSIHNSQFTHISKTTQ